MTQGGSSVPEVQRLLAALTASKPTGRIAEAGTGFGDGALAIVGALGPEASFVTVEIDPARSAVARETLAKTRAEVILGSWREVLPGRAPFDLLFLDGGVVEGDVNIAAGLLAPGGILVKDDLTPGRSVADDPLRQALVDDARLDVVEVMVTRAMAVILAVRRASTSST